MLTNPLSAKLTGVLFTRIVSPVLPVTIELKIVLFSEVKNIFAEATTIAIIINADQMRLNAMI
jgi:hypothetical protein